MTAAAPVTTSPARLRRPSRHQHRFDHRHIPQHPSEWVGKHLDGPIDIHPNLVPRITAIALVDLTADCGFRKAARLLELPDHTWPRCQAALRHLDRKPAAILTFHHALDAIAADLDTRPHLVDYQRRRHTLATWSMPVPDWNTLIGQIAQRRATPGINQAIDWTERKRRIASVLIWTHITQGDPQASLIITDHTANQPHQLAARVHYALHRIQTAKPTDHYTHLARLLTIYADQLATQIDGGALPATDTTSGWRPLWMECGLTPDGEQRTHRSQPPTVIEANYTPAQPP